MEEKKMEKKEQSVTQQENVEQDTNNYIEAIKEIKAMLSIMMMISHLYF